METFYSVPFILWGCIMDFNSPQFLQDSLWPDSLSLSSATSSTLKTLACLCMPGGIWDLRKKKKRKTGVHYYDNESMDTF